MSDDLARNHEGLSFFVWREARLITFLESRGYSIEYCMGTDLQRLPDLERHYELLIGCGHDEYWSAEMRGTVEARIARGGSVAFFTGDLCGWQIRLEGDDRIVCGATRRQNAASGNGGTGSRSKAVVVYINTQRQGEIEHSG